MTREEYGAAYSRGLGFTVNFLLSKGLTLSDAEDLAQSAWTKGLERLGQLRDNSAVTARVNTTALNLVRDKMRKEKGIVMCTGVPERTFDPHVTERVEVRRMLERLPSHEYFLSRKYIDGLKVREIAKETGLTEGAVKYHLALGRKTAAIALGA